MKEKINERLRWGILGGILGGLIALIGYWILSPPTNSLILFVLLRVVVGAIVATIAGPLLLNKRKIGK